MVRDDDPQKSGHWVPAVSETTAALRGFLESHEQLVGRQARRLGMNTTDMQTLRLLDVHGPLGPAELAHRLNLRSASVTALLDRLAADGRVERRRDPRDRRRITVHVLPHASAQLYELWVPLVQAIDDVSRSMAPSDQEAVRDYLNRLAALVDEHKAPPATRPERTKTGL